MKTHLVSVLLIGLSSLSSTSSTCLAVVYLLVDGCSLNSMFLISHDVCPRVFRERRRGRAKPVFQQPVSPYRSFEVTSSSTGRAGEHHQTRATPSFMGSLPGWKRLEGWFYPENPERTWMHGPRLLFHPYVPSAKREAENKCGGCS